MPKSDPEQLTTTLSTEVPATLILHPAYGPDRLATEDDLRRMGYRHHEAMYKRLMDQYDRMDADPDDPRWSLLRYFIEYVTTYDHNMDSDDLTSFRRMIESAARTEACDGG